MTVPRAPLLVLVFIASLTLPALAEPTTLSGRPTVIDGNTIEIAGEIILLKGIDAPEPRQICRGATGTAYDCGEMATFALIEIIETHWITCRGNVRDPYQRLIATCYAGPYDIGEKLLRRGWALADPQYSKDYGDAEKTARTARLGLWQ